MNNLKRCITLPLALFYGVWIIVWAWIYVMIGKIAWSAWMFSVRSLVFAWIFCIITGLSYAELTTRYPKSGWAASFIEAWFQKRWAGIVSWLLICLAWVVSTSVLAKWFSSYATSFLPQFPEIIVSLWIVTLFVIIAGLWISLSTKLISIITSIEVWWILFIIRIARSSFPVMAERRSEMIPPLHDLWTYSAILWWAFLSFYAFIWFEKIAHLAEEMVHPRHDLPKAIIWSILLSAVLYILVAVVAIYGLPLEILGNTTKPLAVIYESITGKDAYILSLVSLIAISNWILGLLIMWSRILFSMGNSGWIPKIFSWTHQKTQSPLFSLWVIYSIIVLLILTFPLGELVKYTNVIIISIFLLVNISLIKIKNYTRNKPKPLFEVPYRIPVCGVITNVLFLIYALGTTFF